MPKINSKKIIRIDYEDYEGVQEKLAFDSRIKNKNFTVRKDLEGNMIGKEYGFRVKGPEPTRYGDWERNGRCTDF